jgi:hypothetical protein
MFRSLPGPLPVGLWVVAVLGATAVMVSPITPWLVPLEAVGLATCLVATVTLVVWFGRH